MEADRELCRRELLKGSTDTLILSLLSGGAMYGYQLVQEMEKKSSGYFRLKEGTLYPALHRLERDEFVEGRWEESHSGQSRRYYHITSVGRHRLECMLEEWDLFTRAVERIARPVGRLLGRVFNVR
jgi:PadR family transcriptional regulator PadR